MNTSIEDHATAIGRAAKAAYLEAHPEPKILDFTCPRCEAGPGQSCDSPQADKVANSHLPRQDRHARAFNARQQKAGQADDAAYTRAYNEALRAQNTPKDAS
ncbi:hypothetical protein OIE13_16995 [Streptosporangium sp. NBC_01810]|uniref:zinc finger domain-containing protein n=1 Tax=Streptosporangium sp. NBC_01810 TaxID=2975951 RepID=UPI002DDC7B2B|nr:hypothetical protein [Streptosporangium sp. NBC_01810]WSA29424.1 hypothetical protein OIE13_16995 [Streptosporangium sp. NBC_01810]